MEYLLKSISNEIYKSMCKTAYFIVFIKIKKYIYFKQIMVLGTDKNTMGVRSSGNVNKSFHKI